MINITEITDEAIKSIQYLFQHFYLLKAKHCCGHSVVIATKF